DDDLDRGGTASGHLRGLVDLGRADGGALAPVGPLVGVRRGVFGFREGGELFPEPEDVRVLVDGELNPRAEDGLRAAAQAVTRGLHLEPLVVPVAGLPWC